MNGKIEDTAMEVLCFLEFGDVFFSEWFQIEQSKHSRGESQREHTQSFWPCRMEERMWRMARI